MNIYILNTLATGLDAIGMLKGRVPVKGIIGLSEREKTDSISGYAYLKPYCLANGIDFIEVEDYSLRSRKDRDLLESLSIHILLVFGWQRLIPGWLIERCGICAVGSHGSAYGISGGRGRSPQNWAILMGRKEFFISLFRIDTGTDTGDIISTSSYEINPFDDIKTSYYKASMLTSEMIADLVRDPETMLKNACRQPREGRYLPQRTPEDGEIDWTRGTTELHDFIRALTRPYPGAFSPLENDKLTVWRSRPFSESCPDPALKPGQIARIFHGGDILVRTGTGLLLVEDYTILNGTTLREGLVLPSCGFALQMQGIIDRHYRKYPELALAEDIHDLALKKVGGVPA